jgi:hypothetical protein
VETIKNGQFHRGMNGNFLATFKGMNGNFMTMLFGINPFIGHDMVILIGKI